MIRKLTLRIKWTKKHRRHRVGAVPLKRMEQCGHCRRNRECASTGSVWLCRECRRSEMVRRRASRHSERPQPWPKNRHATYTWRRRKPHQNASPLLEKRLAGMIARTERAGGYGINGWVDAMVANPDAGTGLIAVWQEGIRVVD